MPAPDPDLARQHAAVDAFFSAARAGDFDSLVALLDPGVELRIDAGPRRASIAVRGAAAVARHARSGLARLLQAADLQTTLVNGAAGVVATVRGRPIAVIGFTVSAGKIVEIDAIAEPERVRYSVA